jgi:hypothetical protein
MEQRSYSRRLGPRFFFVVLDQPVEVTRRTGDLFQRPLETVGVVALALVDHSKLYRASRAATMATAAGVTPGTRPA